MSRNIEALVTRQIRRWEAEVKARDRKARQPAPSIAFSRLVHAGGEEVATWMEGEREDAIREWLGLGPIAQLAGLFPGRRVAPGGAQVRE